MHEKEPKPAPDGSEVQTAAYTSGEVELPADEAEVAALVESNEALGDMDSLTPPGWTMLEHGTSSERWSIDLKEVDEVTLDSDLSVVTSETARRDERSGASSARTFGRGAGEPFEINVVFPAEGLSGRGVTSAESEPLAEKLTDDDLEFVDRVYFKNLQSGRHPVVPRGEKLVKIGQHYDAEKQRDVFVFVPERMQELYAGEFEDGNGELESTAELPGEAEEEVDAGPVHLEAATRDRVEDQPDSEEDGTDKSAESSEAGVEDDQELEQRIQMAEQLGQTLAANMKYLDQGDRSFLLRGMGHELRAATPEAQAAYLGHVAKLMRSELIQSLAKQGSVLGAQRPVANGSMLERVAHEAEELVRNELIAPLVRDQEKVS